MDVAELVTECKQGRHFVVAIEDRFSECTKTKPTSNIISTTVPLVFVGHWVVNDGIPSKLLANRCPPFLLELSTAVSSTVRMNNIIITMYQPQIKCWAERFNSTLISRLR